MTVETYSPTVAAKQESLMGPFMYDKAAVQPLELWRRYAESPHGLHHAGQPLRYHQHYDSCTAL